MCDTNHDHCATLIGIKKEITLLHSKNVWHDWNIFKWDHIFYGVSFGVS